MNYIYIGKIVNTHGLKGEIRILSDFEFKDKVFVPNMKIYIGCDHNGVTLKEINILNGSNKLTPSKRNKKGKRKKWISKRGKDKRIFRTFKKRLY